MVTHNTPLPDRRHVAEGPVESPLPMNPQSRVYPGPRRVLAVYLGGHFVGVVPAPVPDERQRK